MIGMGLLVASLPPALMLVNFLAQKPVLDDVAYSRVVFDRNGRLLRLTLSQDQNYRLFTPLADIPPRLRDAVLLNEDRYFADHIGINPAAIMRAFWHSYIVKGRRVGGSTITMQLARLRFGINSHSPRGKLIQMARALQLELHYSKDQLLEAYLNRASYGYNIEGVGAASTIYFHAKPQNLTLVDAMTLAVIPQSPLRRRPQAHHPDNPALLAARNRLFAAWLGVHPADRDEQPFFTLPSPVYGIRDLPWQAPHLTHALLAANPGVPRITASIDLGIQHMLQTILRHYVHDHRIGGLNNASAMLVDTRNMQAIAAIGSADFTDHAINGQVDGTRARRSPGSTLKPFIYALAMDQGLIHPLSILGDTPVHFAGYTPDNFDRDFQGPISARDALRRSRNIPAIKLAAQLHHPDLYAFLQHAGVQGLQDRAHYGLSLVLGGAEVTERDLAVLYAMLANDGVLQPVSFQTGQGPYPATRLLSKEASFLTLDMLQDQPDSFATSRPAFYWKTGTSNGFRDAWTAGIFGHYALVVWVGNFNGASNPGLIGARAAAPLFFALAEAVNTRGANPDLMAAKVPQLHIRRVAICGTTGDLAGPACPVPESGWFIPGVSPIHNQDIYRSLLVDTGTGLLACHAEPGRTAYRNFEIWPSDMQAAMERAGIYKTPLPAWQPECRTDPTRLADSGHHPVITAPQSHMRYQIHMGDQTQKISFQANADGGVHQLYWFLGRRYLGNSAPGESFLWTPLPGHYAVRVVDDQGRADTSTLSVTFDTAQP